MRAAQILKNSRSASTARIRNTSPGSEKKLSLHFQTSWLYIQRKKKTPAERKTPIELAKALIQNQVTRSRIFINFYFKSHHCYFFSQPIDRYSKKTVNGNLISNGQAIARFWCSYPEGNECASGCVAMRVDLRYCMYI